MTLQECYKIIGGDYQDTLARMGSDKLVDKFACKFLNDTSFQAIEKHLKENNQEDAFRAAHTLKGVCLNLGFTRLGKSSIELTEALRNEMSPNVKELMNTVTLDYHLTYQTIKAYQESKK